MSENETIPDLLQARARTVGLLFGAVVIPASVLLTVGAPEMLILGLATGASIALPWLVRGKRPKRSSVQERENLRHRTRMRSQALASEALTLCAQDFQSVLGPTYLISHDRQTRLAAEVVFTRWIANYEHIHNPEVWLRNAVARESRDHVRHRRSAVGLDSAIVHMLNRQRSHVLLDVQREFLELVAIRTLELPFVERHLVRSVYDIRLRDDRPEIAGLTRAAKFLRRFIAPLGWTQSKLDLLASARSEC